MKRLIEQLGRRRAIGLAAGGATMLAILIVSASPAHDSPHLPDAVRPPSRAVPPAQVTPAPRVAAMSTPAPIAAAKPVASGPFVVRRILRIDKPLRHGDWYWDDADVPPGPIVITVDLQAEMLSVFRGGYEIGTAVVNYGDEAYMTPLGTFPITQKDADHSSSIYDAKMPYMLRLTNDGVTIHGADVAWDHATHGCIAVPTPFARKLFNVVKLGDRVIITRGKMMGVGDAITRS
jgi:lipoprotein-anchoring transpeptidase ErfK/SrfK